MHACNSPAAPVLRAARGLSARSARARLVASPLAARRRSGAASTFMADGQSEGMVWRQGYYEKAGNGDLVWRCGSYAARGAAVAARACDGQEIEKSMSAVFDVLWTGPKIRGETWL